MTNRPPPAWVRKRDGRLAPFEPDRICRDLFDATVRIGSADPVLARELTDGILHFLADWNDEPIPTTSALAEQIAKIVRELGRPEIAASLRQGGGAPPPLPPTQHDLDASLPPHRLNQQLAGSILSEFSLQQVYPQDVAAAHRDRLLTIAGLDHPFELAALYLNPLRSVRDLDASIAAARQQCGGWLLVDAPEYALTPQEGDAAFLAGEFVDHLRRSVDLHGVGAVLNLNVASPPPWAAALAAGPLFASDRAEPDRRRRRELTAAILAHLAQSPSPDDGIRLMLHLDGADFEPANAAWLRSAIRSALACPSAEFALDRPPQSPYLGGGLWRSEGGALAYVGIDLGRIAEITSAADVDVFHRKLGTISRLARAAGHAKLDFLRRRGRPVLQERFLLDRVRLVVVPLGLDAVSMHFFGRGICDGGESLSFARRTLDVLRDALAPAAPHSISSIIAGFPAAAPFERGGERAASPSAAAGVTSWDELASPRLQIQATAELLNHPSIRGSCAVRTALSHDLFLISDALKTAWGSTNIQTITFPLRKDMNGRLA